MLQKNTDCFHNNNLPIAKLGDDHDWPKALLLGNKHVVLYISEDSWVEEKSRSVNPLASIYKCSSFLHTNVNIFK